ncbi:MAG: CHAT domain-containing protein [Piscinibacter sp.]|uniref:CHAT domain-containing tetratricopeptide repeat protein n=1 Tax=Piscinibacter TaxID=1114981 RepID=UPI000FDECF47|nr:MULTISPECIES: CHAT domain-containing protein [Piscinibacter]MCW5665324.1 CHAT domain-containing protein [Piscinibacter sp.]
MPNPAARAARQLVDGADAPLPQPLPVGAAALAVALKDEAAAAWGTTPSRALRCAALLRALQQRHAEPGVAALADWAAGLAALVEGRMADALQCFDAAQAGLAALGRGHEAAQTQVPKLIALSVLGRHDEALACAEATRAVFIAAGDLRSAGKVEQNLGTMMSRRDRHAEAEAWFRRAAVHAARAGDRELSIRADIGQANALTWQYRFDEALRINERARLRAARHGHTVLTAHAHQAIGRIELNRGRWPLALRELATACRLLEQTGASPAQRIEAEAALADAYLAVSLLPEARALYDRVIEAAERLALPTERAWALLQRARVDARAGDVLLARAGFATARALYLEQDNPAAQALAELGAGALELAQGDAAAAAAHAARALHGLAGRGILGWTLEARALQAAAQAAAGDAEGARRGFEAVLAEGAALADVTLAGRRGLAGLAWQRGDRVEARAQAQAVLAEVDAVRAALPEQALRSAVAGHAEAAHDLLVQLDLDAAAAPGALLATIEQGRSRALAAAAAPEVVPDAGRTALQWARERRQAALAEGDADAAAALSAELARREFALLEETRRAQLTAAREPASPPASARLDPAALVAALAPDEAVLVYHLLPDRLVACVATAAGVRSHAWPIGGLDERLRGLQLQLDALRHGRRLPEHAPRLLQRVRQHLQALHALLWAPLAPLLQGRPRVALVPHRALHYVPFAALHDGTRWLVETHELRLLPSAGWRLRPGTPARVPRQVLALGHGDAALPQVAAEVQAVAAVYGGGARVLLGAAATRGALAELGPGCDLLHLACHGQFRADNPWCSWLALADGPLSVYDLPALRLDAPLVVLSACETGRSRVAPGDELLGWVRAFLRNGSAAVLASQWAVDDGSTAELMGELHRRLAAGAAPAAALAAAQRGLAAAGLHPFHWAAFALFGRG